MQKNQILEKKSLAPAIKLLKLFTPEIANKTKPGQFIVLRIDEIGERIPLTIADSDKNNGTITIIFQEVGVSTIKLGLMNQDEVIKDIIGPLGHPTKIEKFGNVVCIGGGIGVAPIYPIAKDLKKKGNKVISIIGAKTKNLLILEEEMRKISDELLITTDDGSYGKKGFVTDALNELIKQNKINYVFAIGPVVMMQSVCNLTKSFNLKTIVSLNPIMVDATGMCGACRVTVDNKTKFVCVDGPEFDGHLVDFQELQIRQKFYLNEEKKALDIFHKKCYS